MICYCMFLLDKYTPKNVEDVLFHKEKYELLKNMAEDKSIPHIIFHGKTSTGKKTMINIFLKLLFGDSAYSMYDAEYQVKGGSKSNIEIIRRSDHHIILKPKNTNYDRYLVQDVVKDYAKRVEFCSLESDNPFKVIQIDQLDRFTYYAQTSLRRTMENYSSNCRFIMWCRCLSKVIEPIQSRCICIRLPRLDNKDMLSYVSYVLAMEKKMMSLDNMREIVNTSEGSSKNALWNIQNKILGFDGAIDYEKKLEELATLIVKGRKDLINKLRNIIFNSYITNISYEKIVEDMLGNIIMNHHISEGKLAEIIIKTSEKEHGLVKCRRGIIHFDGIIMTIMQILEKN